MVLILTIHMTVIHIQTYAHEFRNDHKHFVEMVGNMFRLIKIDLNMGIYLLYFIYVLIYFYLRLF